MANRLRFMSRNGYRWSMCIIVSFCDVAKLSSFHHDDDAEDFLHADNAKHAIFERLCLLVERFVNGVLSIPLLLQYVGVEFPS